MEHHTVGVWEEAASGMSGDDSARFLRELRQLRDYAGLGQTDLAARAHYPHDYIRAAEAGPSLPDLPLLSAYVRGCGGTLEDWEERWRQLTNTPALTTLPTRSAGASTAASAGSRIGLAFQDADAPDPAAIMAALNRVAEKIAADPSSAPRPSRPAPSRPAPETALSAWSSSVSAPSAPGEPDSDAPPPATAPGSGAMAGTPSSGAAAGTPGSGAKARTPANGATSVSGRTRAAASAARRSFALTSRTTIAALIALAICVVVAVLAVFA